MNKAVNPKLQQQITQALLKLHQTDVKSLQAIKAAWSEAKQATHFISIKEDYYLPYLKQFGNEMEVESITRKFIQ